MCKDIKGIITHLDTYLSRTGQPTIDPVEANAILSRAGLLTDSKDRPGKPLRDLLRKGLLPHAFQSGGKGSSWTIPHSSKRTSKIAPTVSVSTKVEKPTRVIKTTQVSTADISQLEKILMNDKSFKSAGSIDNIIPPTLDFIAFVSLTSTNYQAVQHLFSGQATQHYLHWYCDREFE